MWWWFLFSFLLFTLRQKGGVYIYSNLKGCDGERVYYDGSSMIALNGEMLAQGQQFSIEEVEVVSATVDLDDIVHRRNNPGYGSEYAQSRDVYPKIPVDFALCFHDGLCVPTSPVIPPQICRPEEEIGFGPACWLWDYLRRSGCNGFFLPLSGGE